METSLELVDSILSKKLHSEDAQPLESMQYTTFSQSKLNVKDHSLEDWGLVVISLKWPGNCPNNNLRLLQVLRLGLRSKSALGSSLDLLVKLGLNLEWLEGSVPV